MRELSVLVVGCGRAGEALHIPSFLALDGCNIIGVCDTDFELVQAVASKYELQRAWGSLETALDDARPDVIAICSPPQTHPELVELAAASGADIVVEKPVCQTLTEARRILAAAQDTGVKLCAVHNYHDSPAMVAGMKAISSGRIGELVTATKIWTTNSSERMVAQPGHWAQALNGGRWSEAMPHHIYQGLSLLGDMELETLTAHGREHRGIPVDQVQIRFAGQKVFYTVTLAFSNGERYGVLSVFGTQGQLAIGFDFAWLWDWTTREQWVDLTRDASDLAGHVKSGHLQFLGKVMDYFRGEGECPVSESELLRTVELTERVAAQLSAATITL